MPRETLEKTEAPYDLIPLSAADVAAHVQEVTARLVPRLVSGGPLNSSIRDPHPIEPASLVREVRPLLSPN